MSLDLGQSPSTVVAVYWDRVYRYLVSLTGDPFMADDLTQETMLRGMRGASAVRDSAAMLPWLYRVATSAFLDRLRADRRRPATSWPTDDGAGNPIEQVPDQGPGSDRLVEIGEMSASVRARLNELPSHYRAAILLHDGHGLSDQEVADALGISLAAAKIHIHRARASLRSALDAACQFEVDDRGVLVCEPASGQADCPSDCACHAAGATA